MDILRESSENSVLFEYTSAAEPKSDLIKPDVFDFSKMELNSGCNNIYKSPSLKINYLKIDNLRIETNDSKASSHLFYVIEGYGKSYFDNKVVNWNKGDIFTIPFCLNICHTSEIDSRLIWANDEALNEYLGVGPIKKMFEPTFYKKEMLLDFIKKANNEEGALERNRNGVLLSNQQIVRLGTNTLTHTMWSLLNVIRGNTVQKPHKHNSIAIDLCISAEENKVYTLMGKELNEDGTISKPIKRYWKSNSIFITPPGWWHSHHNDSSTEAWVFPIQDAGLHTHLTTLDIRFVS
tara:strand:+ start:473 stop:1351 length:879 start_codon:yes stop_codon:yes gene_type:complete